MDDIPPALRPFFDAAEVDSTAVVRVTSGGTGQVSFWTNDGPWDTRGVPTERESRFMFVPRPGDDQVTEFLLGFLRKAIKERGGNAVEVLTPTDADVLRD